MARNTKAVGKKRAAKKRTQQPNPQTGLYVKRDAATGKFISDNENGSPYQGATKEEIAKMSPVLKKLADYDKKANRAPINYLEVDDFERIVSNLRAMRAEFTEDIPPFGTRYTGTLEGILAQIRSEYFGKELYKGIVNKAVWLFYCLIKNHPFFNGNKRVAVVALFDFLKRNVSELYIDEGAILHDLFRMAIRTSESDPAEIEQVKRYLRRKIRSFILEF